MGLSQDIWTALRNVCRSPRFSLTVVVVLALGTGATSLSLTLVNAVLFSQPNVESPERIVALYGFDSENQTYRQISYPDVRFFRAHREVFQDVSAFLRIPIHSNSATADRNERISGEVVSEDYFRLLGIGPHLGQFFEPVEHQPGSYPFVVISHAFWQSRFGSNPRVVGQKIRLGGHVFRVLGVAPTGFQGTLMDWGKPPDIWVPLSMLEWASPSFNRMDYRNLSEIPLTLSIARLSPGVTFDEAQAAFRSLGLRLKEVRPQRPQQFTTRMLPLRDARFWPGHQASIRRFLTVVSVVAGLVLVVVCANVSNLFLVRCSRRKKELGIRQAMGGSRWKIVRLLVSETLWLYLAALGLGLMIAAALKDVLLRFQHSFVVQLALDLQLDWKVIVSTIGASLFLSLIFGLLPALNATRFDLLRILKSSTWNTSGSRVSNHLGNLLALTQIALATVLLIATGLMLRGLSSATNADLGFDRQNVHVMSLEFPGQGRDEEDWEKVLGRLPGEVRSLPGVEAAGLADRVPMSMIRSSTALGIMENGTVREVGDSVEFALISEGYFAVLGIPILIGRDLSPTDTNQGEPVALINRVLADRLWPGDNPVGKRLWLDRDEIARRVIGVVGTINYHTIAEPPAPFMYLSARQLPGPASTLVVRSRESQDAVSKKVISKLAEIDPSGVVFDVRSLEHEVTNAMRQPLALARVLTVLSLVGLSLASISVYSLFSHLVAGRSQELAIRIAVGSTRQRLLAMILGVGVRLSALGLLVGWTASVGLRSALENFLLGSSSMDLWVEALASLILLGAVFAGCLIPALKAARTDPWPALKAV